MYMSGKTRRNISVFWFRHGLRLHDNPALLEALKDAEEFYPIFIFDGESAGTKTVGYNRFSFLLESLKDLNAQFSKHGGKLYLFRGSPESIFKKMWEELGIDKICFEQDCEPIWQNRDNLVRRLCTDLGIICAEKVSHTLWDPKIVIETNGGFPPLTYQMFLHTVSVIGSPPRPVNDPDFRNVKFGILPDYLAEEFRIIEEPLSPEQFNIFREVETEKLIHWEGGETKALHKLKERLDIEEIAYRQGFYLPNQAQPDLLGPPYSQSPALRFGCLSVRRFYWSLHDLYNSVHGGEPPASQNITGQLIWREYFYTMSVNNEFYAKMDQNPICLNIPWRDGDRDANEHLKLWKQGKTGFPFIDAVMRQLLQEGWIHHVGRNAVASFLTRGVLWINWENGLDHFLKYLLDADWSVCAGNWMWVSSSAFEQLLDCSHCICPVNYGLRLDPWGDYVKRYVPELCNYPVEYLYEPWKAPIEIQKKAGCIIGEDYPERIIDHLLASKQNREYMETIRQSVLNVPPHCCPSSEEETRHFMWLPETCLSHAHVK